MVLTFDMGAAYAARRVGERLPIKSLAPVGSYPARPILSRHAVMERPAFARVPKTRVIIGMLLDTRFPRQGLVGGHGMYRSSGVSYASMSGWRGERSAV